MASVDNKTPDVKTINQFRTALNDLVRALNGMDVEVTNLDILKASQLKNNKQLLLGLQDVEVAIRAIKFPEQKPFPEIPKPKDSVKVSNLSGLERRLAELKSAFDKIKVSPKVDVKVPKITVPRPEVTVNTPEVIVPPANITVDMESLTKEFKKLSKGMTQLEKMATSSNKALVEEMQNSMNGIGQQLMAVSSSPDIEPMFKNQSNRLKPVGSDSNNVLKVTGDNYKTNISYVAAGNGAGEIEYVGKALPGSADSSAKWQIQKLSYDANNKLTDVDWADGDEKYNNVWDDRAGLSYS